MVEITRKQVAAILPILLLATTPAAAQHPDELDMRASPARIATEPQSDDKVRLNGVQFDEIGTVTGTIINRTDTMLRDVRLLVRYDWRWKDERNPGDDSPGRSGYFMVPGDVPALGTLRFTYNPTTPLPVRDDGHFSPSVEISRYTQVRFKKIRRKVTR